MDVSNLTTYDWNNEIPFSAESVKKTIHALIGEGKMVLGLLSYNKEGKKWDITPLEPTSNDIMGSYTFAQMNSTFSITVKAVDDTKCQLSINMGTPRGSWLQGNVAYLQEECNKFINSMTYYLQNPNLVDEWFANAKEKKEKETQGGKKGGCLSVIVILIVVSALSAFCLL